MIGDIIKWVFANWQELGTGLLAILGAFSIIAKITPTKVDDNWIARITRIINKLGLTKKDGT